MKTNYFFYVGIALMSCNQTVDLTPNAEGSSEKTGIFEKGESHSHASDGIVKSVHQIVIKEHIKGERYSYCEVIEGANTYWIATMGGDFKEGATYMYNEGIEKTDYKSTELDRTFDRILLVSALYSSSESLESKTSASAPAPGPDIKVTIPKTSVPIKELVTNSKKYANKSIEVTGKITKVNPGIMDRNWIHLADGSMDSYDFVCTSEEVFPVGHVVTLKGVLAVNKDFGAGYSYDLIVENARKIK
jgi:hypothetical protein